MSDVVVYLNDLNPSVTDTITVDGTPVDLTGGSVRFRMRPSGATTWTVDEAATIVTPAAGTIRYDWMAGDLATGGEHVAQWVVTLGGEEQSTPPFMVSVVGSPLDLCSVAQARAFMRTPPGDTAQDALVAASITRASVACMRYMDRRARPLDTTDQVRLFPVGGAWRSREIHVKDLSASPTTVRVLAEDAATVVATISTADRLLLPHDRQPTDPIEAIRLLPAAGGLDPSWYVEVTGKWGWPVIPADVEEAVIKTVVARLRGEVQGFPGDRLPDDDLLGRPEGIPSGARRLLDYYRTPGIA